MLTHKPLGLVMVAVGLAACDTPAADPDNGASDMLEKYFATSKRIELAEDPQDVIGDIAFIVETRSGEILVGDPLKSRVRRFDSSGRRIAAFGRYGQGPFEFERVGGLAEDASGHVAVIDPRLGKVTLLTSDLTPDTSFVVTPRPRGQAVSVGNRLVLITTPIQSRVPGSRGSAITLMSDQWAPLWSVPAPSPGSMAQYPYWDSYAATPFAAAPGTVVAAYSLTYPIYVYDSAGALRDSLTRAPISFRKAPVLASGAFTGPSADARRKEWLDSFDVIADLTIVDDSLLVVTHGAMRQAQARVITDHRRIDVYHLPSRSKLAEDVALPAGSRVLGGGRNLYLLAAEPPQPWTVVLAEFRPPPSKLR